MYSTNISNSSFLAHLVCDFFCISKNVLMSVYILCLYYISVNNDVWVPVHSQPVDVCLKLDGVTYQNETVKYAIKSTVFCCHWICMFYSIELAALICMLFCNFAIVLFLFLECTPWAIKTCHFVFDCNSHVLQWIFILFVLVKTRMSTLQFTYLTAWWPHNCVTLHGTKVYVIELLLKIHYDDRPLPAVHSIEKVVCNFCRVAQSSSFSFLLGNSFISFPTENLLHFLSKFYLQNSIYLILSSNSMK